MDLNLEVDRRYGTHVPRIAKGSFLLVFLDPAMAQDAHAREVIVEDFHPDKLFLCGCATCVEFMRSGGLLVFTSTGITVIRPSPDGEDVVVEFVSQSGTTSVQ